MKVSFTKFPIGISFCFLWSVIILPIALYSPNITMKTIVGLPYLLFMPGYILICVLFPTKKTDRGIDNYERVALSFGLSIALVTLIGFLLNFTPFGIRLQSFLISLCFIDILLCFLAFYRWYNTSFEKRNILSFEISFLKLKSKIEILLIIFLGLSIILAFSSLIYVISNPQSGEKFTEFYILGSGGKIDKYPQNIYIGETGSVTIGVVNHEYKTINYTIEIWLINETTFYNTSTQANDTVYSHMWFLDKITQQLNSTSIINDKEWTSQWEYNYSFQIKRRGEYKLTFLLFITPTPDYNYYEDYKNIGKQKIEYAYERVYLKLNII